MSPEHSLSKGKTFEARSAIKRAIAAGRLPSGHRLVISQLARELDMSPVPVREAIRLLESEGLVTFIHNVGPQVARFNAVEYQQMMTTLAVLEGAAVAEAIPYLRPDTIAYARSCNRQLVEALQAGQFAQANRFSTLFHHTLYRDCRNEYLLRMLGEGWAKAAAVKGAVFGLLPGRVDALVEEHEHMLKLLGSKPGAEHIERFVREHRQRNTAAFLRFAAGRAAEQQQDQ